MAIIETIYGYEVLDSRGRPTPAARVTLQDGSQATAYVPSGASTGVHEAVEKRDGGERFWGKGVLGAVEAINTEINQALQGQESLDQRHIDQIMIDLDGTDQKSRLGANAILAVSLAVARVSAQSEGLELYEYLYHLYREEFNPQACMRLPLLCFNVLNGGAHADSGLDIQEFMLIPQYQTVHRNVQAGAEVYNQLKGLLTEKGYVTAVGDEGGFAPHLKDNEQALRTLRTAIAGAGYQLGQNCLLGMDAAASEFYDPEQQQYFFEGQEHTAEDLAKVYQSWIDKYHIDLLEDPFAEDDFPAWQNFLGTTGVAVVGDDLLVTNVSRIQKAIDEKLCNAALIKPNQIGSLSETMQAITLAQESGFETQMSHRSGDTEDSFIADLAVATGCNYIKSGAPARSERVSKYNRLMEIENQLNQ